MYESFAAVYDMFMEDVPYEAWAAYIINQLQNTGLPGNRVAELACGTGNITLALAEKGYDVIAGDSSESMLQVAMEKARKAGVRVQFFHGCMENFTVVNHVHAVLAICDAVNYLPPNAITAFFSQAYQAITEGGVLLFDLSTPYRLHTILGDNTFAEENERGAYILYTHKETDALLMELTLFIKQLNGNYFRTEEEHRLYCYSLFNITDKLTKVGFKEVSAVSFLESTSPKETDERILIQARR